MPVGQMEKMKISETRFHKVRRWLTFPPLFILFLSKKSGIIPEILNLIFFDLYLCTFVSMPLIYALIFKEFYWGPLTKDKNPKTYNLTLFILAVTILCIVFKTCIDLMVCLSQ
jgi:hypothetical protein